MSEVMAIESIAEEYAKFNGYLTDTRVPFKLKRSHSDIDVLGFNPKKGTSLIIECKAWGSPDQYPSYNQSEGWFRKKFREILEKWKFFKKSPTNKWELSRLDEIWLVVPGYCDDKDEVEKSLSQEFEKKLRIIPIHELLLDIMFKVKEDKDVRRKRYSNPALEFCRWLLRSYYANKLSLIDIDLKLKGENQTYQALKEKYFKDSLRIIEENVKKRGKNVHTRKKALELLCGIRKKATIPDLAREAQKRKFDLDRSGISDGLSTWVKLGIVIKNDRGEFSINDSFKSIIRKEIEH